MITEFTHKIIDMDDKGNVVNIGTKTLYNLDESNSLSKWIKEPIKNLKNKIEYSNFTSGIQTADEICKPIYHIENSIGFLISDCNDIYNRLHMCILSSPRSQKSGGGHSNISIHFQNFLRCVSAFTARFVVDCTWLNGNDEFLAPNEQHPKFEQFQNDSIIYSLFNSSSQQTSLRNIQYHNKIWNIRNNFFWCSNSWIKALAELYNNEQVYNDLIQYPSDPYVYTLIGQKITNREPFGRTALEVLSKASHLLETTFPYRNEFNNEHPEYQVNNWDAGWYQIKQLCKKYKEKEYKEFRELFIQFRKELEPLVYELGFLKE